jgi:transitional endoplasmic reticulum ATPase
MTDDLALTVMLAAGADDGTVRIDPLDMRLLNVQAGDIVGMQGKRTTYARVRPALMEERNQRLAGLGALSVHNLGLAEGEKVVFSPQRARAEIADAITLTLDDDLDHLHVRARARELGSLWHGRPVVEGDGLALPGLDRNPLVAHVQTAKPQGLVQIGTGTVFTFVERAGAEGLPRLGGLRDLYRSCFNLASTRVKDAPAVGVKSVLLIGPAGCGKARLVERLAVALQKPLVALDAHVLIDRAIAGASIDPDFSLTDLAKRGGAIVRLDHLEALNESATEAGLTAAKRRVTALLVDLLDDVRLQRNIMLFGVASEPLTERLADGDRFGLVLPVEAPNRVARQEILMLATAGVPLAEDVDLARLAAMTPGTTARDLVRLVATASSLATGPKVSERHFVAAYPAIAPSAASEVRCDIPTTSWDDVAGLDDLKQLLGETLSWSLRYREKFVAAGVRPPRSILLSGGQGTGKTSLVRALANFTPLHFIEIACPLLAARSVLDSVRYIRDSFALARRKAPCVVFFDDIDVLFEIAGPAAAPHLHPIVAQLLAELDDINLIYGVVVIAATNRPDRLSTDVLRPGRFDFAVTLPMPDQAARRRIFEIHARKLPLAEDVDFDRLAAATQGLSPAEIANLCSRVGLIALRQSLNAADGARLPPVVNADLFEQGLRGRKN